VPTGVSTGHPAITAGTIAARVTDGINVYALSNNHVYADENQAALGDEMIQPGTYDGGSLRQTPSERFPTTNPSFLPRQPTIHSTQRSRFHPSENSVTPRRPKATEPQNLKPWRQA